MSLTYLIGRVDSAISNIGVLVVPVYLISVDVHWLGRIIANGMKLHP